tara:strand:+ start:676 stop:891 length:216 start_codon:yes stop_codon:yes gene_type:complete
METIKRDEETIKQDEETITIPLKDFERIRKPFLTLWECNECEVCDWFSDGDEEKHKELQKLIRKYIYQQQV